MKVKFKTWEQLLKIPNAELINADIAGDRRVQIGESWIGEYHLSMAPEEFEVKDSDWEDYDWVTNDDRFYVSRWMVIDKEDAFDKLYERMI